MDRSVASSLQKRVHSVAQRHKFVEQGVGAMDSISSASLMEVTETSRLLILSLNSSLTSKYIPRSLLLVLMK